eukprot:g37887.t1
MPAARCLLPRQPQTTCSLVTAADVRLVFLRINPRKVTCPDRVPDRALGSCADQLAEIFTDIFNLSFLQAEVPTCFKKATIIPVPKKAHHSTLEPPKRCILSPLLHSLYTHHSVVKFRMNAIYKFADDPTM